MACAPIPASDLPMRPSALRSPVARTVPRAPAAHDQRAGVHPGGIGVARRGRSAGCRGRRLLVHGHGFAGQQRFIDGEIRRLVKLHVGRDAIAFGQQDDVAVDEFPAGDARFAAGAQHPRAGAGKIAQRLQRALGAALLDEVMPITTKTKPSSMSASWRSPSTR